MMKKTKMTDALDLPIEEVQRKLNKAHQSYKDAKKDAFNWRDEFLTEMAKQNAKKNNTTEQQELKNLQHREWQKRTAKNIKRARGKLNRSAMTQVWGKNVCLCIPWVDLGRV